MYYLYSKLRVILEGEKVSPNEPQGNRCIQIRYKEFEKRDTLISNSFMELCVAEKRGNVISVFVVNVERIKEVNNV